MSKKRHSQVATESRQRMKRGRLNRFQKIRILGNKRKVQRLAGSKVQVPNNVAWDAKLQSIKGPDNNESQSIISCLEHNGTNKECRHKMIYLHTR